MYFNQIVEGNEKPQMVMAPNETYVTAPGTNDNLAFRATELLQLHESLSTGPDFEATKELAMECVDQILEHWLPDGEMRGREFVALNPIRNDGELGSFSINTETGAWADFATDDKGSDVISLIKYVTQCKYQSEAAVMILKFIARIRPNNCPPTNKQRIGSKVKSESGLILVIPIPENAAPRPQFFGSLLGMPSATWEYRDASGKPLCYVNRFNTAQGKSFMPQTYWRDSSGSQFWKSQAIPAPRPAYGLDRLAARPDAPVLFNEGEKSADAAQRLFPDFVAATTMNGAQSPEKTDFTPFAGRQIYIAPDNDAAGTAYKERLIVLLRAVGAQVVAVLRLEALRRDSTDLTEGYDLADAEVDGWTTDSLKAAGEALWAPVPLFIPDSAGVASFVTQTQAATPPKKMKPLDFANDFAMRNHGGNLAVFNNQILAYRTGYWPALNPDVDVKRPILHAMDDSVTASKVNSVFELIKLQYASLPERFERTSSLICLNNGTLNPETGELLPHSVEHYLTNKVDIVHDENARCPLWLQTLDEIFAPDSDKAAKIQLVQEYMGYCLIPDTTMHKFLWMVGSGGNGKSLILAIISALIGKVNLSYAPIERLEEKFVRAELQGKLVNISSEMSARATVSDGYLKQITAGDIIEAERKNERPFSFKPYARLIGATNTLPRLLDHSDGFFRRAMILRFNRQFTEAERDSQREARLMAELPGILNWAVAGLQSLRQRGSFEIPDSARTEVDQYRVNSDPVRQFADEFLTHSQDRNLDVPSSLLYEYYKVWSGENGYRTLATNQFAERLSGIGYAKEKRKEGRFWIAEYNAPATRSFSPPRSPVPPRYTV